MEAHLVKPGTKVMITDKDVRIPPAAKKLEAGDVLIMGKLDGMYCNAEDEEGDRVYLAGWTEVERI